VTKSDLKTVGVREFRERLSEHLMSESPIAVTKHGLTVGYYIPTHHPISDADREALERAAQRLNELLEAKGIDPETLIQEVKESRRRGKRKPNG
jgi:PHD/YefM family antitoxin component YafN of YafNO toxin-antitoxin module